MNFEIFNKELMPLVLENIVYCFIISALVYYTVKSLLFAISYIKKSRGPKSKHNLFTREIGLLLLGAGFILFCISAPMLHFLFKIDIQNFDLISIALKIGLCIIFYFTIPFFAPFYKRISFVILLYFIGKKDIEIQDYKSLLFKIGLYIAFWIAIVFIISLYKRWKVKHREDKLEERDLFFVNASKLYVEQEFESYSNIYNSLSDTISYWVKYKFSKVSAEIFNDYMVDRLIIFDESKTVLKARLITLLPTQVRYTEILGENTKGRWNFYIGNKREVFLNRLIGNDDNHIDFKDLSLYLHSNNPKSYINSPSRWVANDKGLRSLDIGNIKRIFSIQNIRKTQSYIRSKKVKQKQIDKQHYRVSKKYISDELLKHIENDPKYFNPIVVEAFNEKEYLRFKKLKSKMI